MLQQKLSQTKKSYKIILNSTLQEVKERKKKFDECKMQMSTELVAKTELVEQQKHEMDHKERYLRALL